jgi:hypothetical protein
MYQERVRQTLANIIRTNGAGICETPRRVENLLRDLCPELRLEINVLVTAMRAQVPRDLVSVPVSNANLMLPRLTDRLCQSHGIETSHAQWAVESFAIALGRLSISTTRDAPTLPYIPPFTRPVASVNRHPTNPHV